MPLSNPFRRGPSAPTLRQRAADLKARAARVVRRAKPLPEAGSPEAMAQWEDAGTLADRLTDFAITDYLDLKRTPLEWWTRATIGPAVEAGEITPAEGARLYRRASERELRLTAIRHRLDVGALHFLANAADYPFPVEDEDEPDPIHAAIAAHVAAREAFEATVSPADVAWVRQQGGDASPEAMATAEAARADADAAETAAWRALFEVRPATLPGVLALARHAQRYAPNNDGINGGPRLEDVFGAIADGLAGVIGAPAIRVEP